MSERSGLACDELPVPKHEPRGCCGHFPKGPNLAPSGLVIYARSNQALLSINRMDYFRIACR